MACICVVGGLHARIAQYGDKRTHTLQWPRAHTLLGNNADDMVLALTNFVFLLLFGAGFWYDLTFTIS
jgi:hypothetical protein